MSDGYISLDLIGDSDALVEASVDYMENSIPGFVARPGNVETVLIEANAQIGSEIVAQAGLVDPAIFSYLGQNLLGIGMRDALPASANSTWVFEADAQAMVVSRGSLIAVPSPIGVAIPFATVADILAPAGGGAQSVGVVAIEPGEAGNGCFGEAEMIDVIDGVASVTVTTSAGGQDPEETQEYLDRLAQTMTILAPRPILPQDFSTMAALIPGVGRAITVDLYYPGTLARDAGMVVGDYDHYTPQPPPPEPSSPHARCVTTYITDENGDPPSDVLLNEVWTTLDRAREINFLVYVGKPGTETGYTAIDVDAQVTAYPGNLAPDIVAACEESLRLWLDPLTWGSPSGTGDQWAVDPKVRLYEAVEYLNRAIGVHWVDAVQLKLATDSAWTQGDLTLPGAMPMPVLGTATIQVTVPLS